MGLPGTYLKATLHFRNTTTGATATCVLFYLGGVGFTAPTLSTVSTAANGFKTAYSTAVAAALVVGTEMNKVTLKYVAGGSEVEGDNTNGAVAGTTAGDQLPEEVVICIQKRTGQVGRSKRGRIFFPFISEDFQSNGELEGDGITAAAALATMVKSDVTASPIGTCKPHHLDSKNSTLIPIVQAGYVTSLCSRRDRRSPKVLASVRI